MTTERTNTSNDCRKLAERLLLVSTRPIDLYPSHIDRAEYILREELVELLRNIQKASWSDEDWDGREEELWKLVYMDKVRDQFAKLGVEL